jgi:hypothetical protein
MMSAVEYAEKLGIRRAWSQNAVWDEEGGINHDIKSVASIRFGPLVNESVVIHTTNILFQKPESNETRTIPQEDLEWYEYQTQTPLPEDEKYHLMAFTRLDVDIAGTQITVPEFFNQHKNLRQGLHRDLSTLLFKNQVQIHVLQANSKRDIGSKKYNKHFSLEALAKVWRSKNVSSRLSAGYSPNGTRRVIYGGTGSPEKLNSIFFGQLNPAGQTFGNWICFMPVELFEQTYLTWIDDITGPVFKHHLEHCGLRLRKPNP